jgi:hypothetical protein
MSNHRTDFKVTTYSNYQRSAVKKEWIACMVKGQLERSCYWTVEMVQTGMFSELWELILFFFGKYIHAGNPKLPLYLDMRYNLFLENVTDVELDMRECETVRKLFAEIVCILCLSNRKPSIESVEIATSDGIPTSRLKAPTIEYILAFKPTDPKELFVSINEFGFMLQQHNTEGALFWIEWILRYLKKHKCSACPRPHINTKKPSDPIWLVWESIRAYSNAMLPIKILDAIIHLYGMAYTNSVREKRKWLLYYGVALCCDPIEYNVNIITDKQTMQHAYQNCAKLYI